MQPQNSQAALTNLQGFQAGAKKPEEILAAQQAQYGVPAAQQTVQGLRTAVANTSRLLNQVAPSVMGRTANSLVTSGQATRQVANEQAPIAAQLQSRGSELSTASADAQSADEQAARAAELQYGGQQGQMSYLQSVYDALYKREQDEKLFSEQQRQFNESQNLSRENARLSSAAASSYATPSFAIPGGNAATTKQTDAAAAEKNSAANAVMDLLGTNDANIIRRSIDAITKSAGYGNARDQLKLQLLKSLGPQYFSAASAKLPGASSANLTGPLTALGIK